MADEMKTCASTTFTQPFSITKEHRSTLVRRNLVHPTGKESVEDDLTRVRVHKDAHLAHMKSIRPDLAKMNSDPDFLHYNFHHACQQHSLQGLGDV